MYVFGIYLRIDKNYVIYVKVLIIFHTSSLRQKKKKKKKKKTVFSSNYC